MAGLTLPSGDDTQLWLRFQLNYTEQTESGTKRYAEHFRLHLFSAWEIADAVQKMGGHQALEFARFAVTIARLTPTIEQPMPSPEEEQRLTQAINGLMLMFTRQWDTLEDRVIDFTYQWMRRKAMTREMAAFFASKQLGFITTDAWRKKVDRWAKSNGYPALGQTKRRPRKS